MEDVGVSRESVRHEFLIPAGIFKEKLTLKIRPFEGSPDPPMLMIFRCAILLYFIMFVYNDFGVLKSFERRHFLFCRRF